MKLIHHHGQWSASSWSLPLQLHLLPPYSLSSSYTGLPAVYGAHHNPLWHHPWRSLCLARLPQSLCAHLTSTHCSDVYLKATSSERKPAIASLLFSILFPALLLLFSELTVHRGLPLSSLCPPLEYKLCEGEDFELVTDASSSHLDSCLTWVAYTNEWINEWTDAYTSIKSGSSRTRLSGFKFHLFSLHVLQQVI